MAYSPIPDVDKEVGKPTKKELFDTLKTNQEDFDDRLSNLEGGISKVIVFNDIVKKATEHKVGDIKISMLTLAQYQAQFDSTWVLADGSSASGTDYFNITANANIPDLRGRYLRAKDHGAGTNPDGDLALGATQDDAFESHLHSDSGHSHAITDTTHSHTLQNDSHSHGVTDPNHTHTLNDTFHDHGIIDTEHTHGITDPGHNHHYKSDGSGASEERIKDGGTAAQDDYVGAIKSNVTGITETDDGFTGIVDTQNSATGNTILSGATNVSVDAGTTGGTLTSTLTGLSGTNVGNASIANTGANETRPKTITLNAFIKVNDSPATQTLIYKAAFAFNILGAVINSLTAGSAGSCEIDIKKGTSLGSLASIFSTKPSVAFGAGNNADSVNAILSDNVVAANDWLQLDITSFQTEQNKFHAFVTGEV